MILISHLVDSQPLEVHNLNLAIKERRRFKQ
jgi:hypothetical protein